VLKAHQWRNNITVYEEDQNDLYKDYLPDEAIMKDLFKSLLDRNPKFIPEEEAPKNTRKIPRTKKKSPKLILPL